MKLWAGTHECDISPTHYISYASNIFYLLQVSMTLCAKLHTALGQMRHCHTLLMWMQIATYLKKILGINEQAISLSVVRLLVSRWMDNEEETDKMNKGVMFHCLLFLVTCQMDAVKLFFPISILSVQKRDIDFGDKMFYFVLNTG